MVLKVGCSVANVRSTRTMAQAVSRAPHFPSLATPRPPPSGVKRHKFNAPINWDALLRKEVKPPFRPPKGNSSDDTRNIDKEFLKMEPHDTPVPQSVMDRLTGGNDTGNDHFEDFSFVDRDKLLHSGGS